ncbi:tetraacyldisaccharide 4'-kinase [Niveibacterium sp. 24ML]|uniref:tetraacyldisaccharide 4'-kinase n=1 Tax=Niveibacterium sp. 24ML TaxID=2985512 RepID=UPI002B4BF077|nr:tetraacyldisaccharide 4'-kinase [Niveibacterium sp. 24ML]
MRSAPRFWKRRGLIAAFLFPLSLLFRGLVALRRVAFRQGWLRSFDVGVPVVVVGNIAVGGSGKTPVVIWLVEALRAAGYHPGVVSRGYGGRAEGSLAVERDTDPALSGDEPVLLAQRCACPIWIGRDRVAAVQAMRAVHPEVDVIVTDDGLQHYRLRRTVEVVVVDAHQMGNRLMLPAGPLREPVSRLAECQLVLAHGDLPPAVRAKCPPAPVFSMRLWPTAFYRLSNPRQRRSPHEFADRRLRALAGIGRPERFFATLHDFGLRPVAEEAYPDHHPFTAEDVALRDADTLVVTEKDAIKLKAFAPSETWVLPVDAEIRAGALDRVLEHLHGPKTA